CRRATRLTVIPGSKVSSTMRTFSGAVQRRRRRTDVMISTRSVELVIDTVVCLTLAKWETVSGQFGGYLSRGATRSKAYLLAWGKIPPGRSRRPGALQTQALAVLLARSRQITGQPRNSKDLELQTVWHAFIESHCVSTEV